MTSRTRAGSTARVPGQRSWRRSSAVASARPGTCALMAATTSSRKVNAGVAPATSILTSGRPPNRDRQHAAGAQVDRAQQVDGPGDHRRLAVVTDRVRRDVAEDPGPGVPRRVRLEREAPPDTGGRRAQHQPAPVARGDAGAQRRVERGDNLVERRSGRIGGTPGQVDVVCWSGVNGHTQPRPDARCDSAARNPPRPPRGPAPRLPRGRCAAV